MKISSHTSYNTTRLRIYQDYEVYKNAKKKIQNDLYRKSGKYHVFISYLDNRSAANLDRIQHPKRRSK